MDVWHIGETQTMMKQQLSINSKSEPEAKHVKSSSEIYKLNELITVLKKQLEEAVEMIEKKDLELARYHEITTENQILVEELLNKNT